MTVFGPGLGRRSGTARPRGTFSRRGQLVSTTPECADGERVSAAGVSVRAATDTAVSVRLRELPSLTSGLRAGASKRDRGLGGDARRPAPRRASSRSGNARAAPASRLVLVGSRSYASCGAPRAGLSFSALTEFGNPADLRSCRNLFRTRDTPEAQASSGAGWRFAGDP